MLQTGCAAQYYKGYRRTGATKVSMFSDTIEHMLPTLWVSYKLTYADKREPLQGEETETGHEMSAAEAVQSE